MEPRERYNLALLYYRANRFDVAAVLLREVALGERAVEDPDGRPMLAADLYLDALNVMGTHDPWSRSPACFAPFGDDVERFRARFCGAPRASDPDDFCRRMTALACQYERRGGMEAEARGARELLVRRGDARNPLVREARARLRGPVDAGATP
jgi:hypothetical protein